MKCPNCNRTNRVGRAFCAQCGAPLSAACGACGFVNEPEDRFCGGCGVELAAGTAKNKVTETGPPRPSAPVSSAPRALHDEAERRPLTIVFTDLVGSTEMSLRLDAEDLREIIRGYQTSCARVIERFGGFVARYMGDGIMSYFGYPHAHEDDAERAIRAALEIVETVRALDADIGAEKGVRLEVRAGLASGLVVVGDLIGEGASEERAVVGDTPNLAARMQGLAKPNSVVVDPAAYRLAGDAFKTEDLGLKEVKGSPQPIRVWQILAPHDPQSRFDTALKARLSPLVGRIDELNQLRELWKRASAGQGQVVLLSGEAGIGKTRLARTAYARIADEETIRVRYQCSPLYTNSALYPFIEQIEFAAGIDRSEQPDLKFEKIQGFLQHFSRDSDESRALLARLLSISPEGRYAELNLGPTQLKQRTISALSDQLLALTDNGPTLVLFEDMHWADPTSMELLSGLVARINDVPLMLICTHRPEHIGQWDDFEHVTTIELERLDAAHSAELIERLLADAGLPLRLAGEILEKTDGVPLFVEELIRSLSVGPGDSCSPSDLAQDLIIPDTLQSSLMSRLDRMDSAKGVAQTGAAIGREFHYKMLAAVVGSASRELDAALYSLQGEALVNRRGLPPDSLYTFRHGLLRDAAYQSLLRRKRQEIHRRIAEVLETDFRSYWESHPEILAHHLTEANELEKATNYWEAAARKAAQGSANIESERHFRRAIELVHLLPESTARAKRELTLLTGMGAVLINNHGPGSSSVTDVYRRCRSLCEEIGRGAGENTSEEHFATLWGLWRTCESLNVAMGLVDQMRVLGEKEKRPDLIMQAHHSGWATLFNLGQLSACLDSIAIGEKLYDVDAHRDHASLYGGHDPQVCAHGVGAVAMCLRGFPDQAAERIERAITSAKRLVHPGSLAHALDWAATFDRMCDRPERTLERAKALTAFGVQHEFADYAARGRVFRGWALARLGSPEDGLAELRAGILAQRETGMSEDFSFFLEMLAEVHGLAGQAEEGLTVIEEALQDALRNEAAFWSSATKRRQALLIVQSDPGRIGEAISCLRESVAIAVEQRARLLELRATLDLGVLLRQSGEIHDACSAIKAPYDGMNEGLDLPVMVEAREFLSRYD
jgi:class 3 adenylate cyclase/predicted ATPase